MCQSTKSKWLTAEPYVVRAGVVSVCLRCLIYIIRQCISLQMELYIWPFITCVTFVLLSSSTFTKGPIDYEKSTTSRRASLRIWIVVMRPWAMVLKLRLLRHASATTDARSYTKQVHNYSEFVSVLCMYMWSHVRTIELYYFIDIIHSDICTRNAVAECIYWV